VINEAKQKRAEFITKLTAKNRRRKLRKMAREARPKSLGQEANLSQAARRDVTFGICFKK